MTDPAQRAESVKKRHPSVNHDQEENIFGECQNVCVGNKALYNLMRIHQSLGHCIFILKGFPKSQMGNHVKICILNGEVQVYNCDLYPFQS